MDFGIRGKRALITGGSSGLGLAAARALAAEGVDIALFAKTKGKLSRVAQDIQSELQVKADWFSGDISIQSDILSLKDWLIQNDGIDILVVNTPRPPSPMRAFLEETDDARWEVAYRNQLESALFLLRHLTPLLTDKGWGRLIGVTSASIKQPMPRHALSSIFRAGVQVALKHLVEELAPFGVTVNTISPATVLTPTFSQFHELERRIENTPLKRAGTMEEFGGTLAFLCSNQAGYITGENIQLDGGMTKALF